jgi:hypothetical protein
MVAVKYRVFFDIPSAASGANCMIADYRGKFRDWKACFGSIEQRLIWQHFNSGAVATLGGAICGQRLWRSWSFSALSYVVLGSQWNLQGGG